MKKTFLYALLLISLIACGKEKTKPDKPDGGAPSVPPVTKVRPASIGIVGDTTDVSTTTKGGTVLMGGGTDVAAAFKWMIDQSGGGDVVIIRVSGTDAYNNYVYALGKVNSVETLKIDTKELANNQEVANIIKNAEMVFIAGGDQSDYMNLWRGTKVQEAINYLLNVKKAPVGGTSAGCAIMSGFYFSGEKGSVVALDALNNPFDSNITIYNNDFLNAPFLQNVITDQHFLTRNREGRSVVFLGRIQKDFNKNALGIAADEKTAVAIDNDGRAKVFGSSRAYFININKNPEQFEAGKKVNWNDGEQALNVYEIYGSETGAGNYNLANQNQPQATGGKWMYWWIDNGEFKSKEK